MNPSKQLGSYLQRIRKARGLTQEKLAELCDLTPEHISGIERGKRFPSIKTLFRLADILRFSLSEAFQFQTPKPLTKIERAIHSLNRVLVKKSEKEIHYLFEMAKRLPKP